MAKDIFHQAVRIALEKDGWKITDDPYSIRLLGVESDIDLGALSVSEHGLGKRPVQLRRYL
ncbi:MAG: XisH family protein, partial [Rudanella sp.]|nr:XisH family protein [Rudanella sp.]